jgi:hypothetical protein
LRIIQAIGEGETPSTDAVTAAATTLNDIIKTLNTDGMPQWNLRTYTCTPLVQGTNSYTIGTGSTFNFPAPLKILQAYLTDNNTNADMPLVLIDRQTYLRYSNKTSQGAPNQLFYQTPLAIQASGEMQGTIYVLPTPDAYSAANKTLVVLGQKDYDDLDSASNTIDLPPYWISAITWNLAADLAYEYGVGLAERSMIAKRADMYHAAALSFGTEEGSLYFQPEPRWDSDGR